MNGSRVTAAGQAGFRTACGLSALVLFVIEAPLEARDRATTNGQAKAAVVSRLSLVKTQDLDFGKIASSAGPGTVTVAPDGTRTATGGALLFGAVAKPARFAGFGFSNQTVLISVQSVANFVTRVGGTETMRFDTIVIGSVPQTQLTTQPRSFRIATVNGMFTFPIGATLRVGAGQAPGTYAGSFAVTISYQ
jgi:hypothetical protein